MLNGYVPDVPLLVKVIQEALFPEWEKSSDLKIKAAKLHSAIHKQHADFILFVLFWKPESALYTSLNSKCYSEVRSLRCRTEMKKSLPHKLYLSTCCPRGETCQRVWLVEWCKAEAISHLLTQTGLGEL